MQKLRLLWCALLGLLVAGQIAQANDIVVTQHVSPTRSIFPEMGHYVSDHDARVKFSFGFHVDPDTKEKQVTNLIVHDFSFFPGYAGPSKIHFPDARLRSMLTAYHQFEAKATGPLFDYVISCSWDHDGKVSGSIKFHGHSNWPIRQLYHISAHREHREP